MADLDCSVTFLAYREMERLVDCAPPVQSVVEVVFANVLYGLWRRRVSARGKSAVHLAEANYSYVVVKILVDVGTDAKLVPFPMDVMPTVEGLGLPMRLCRTGRRRCWDPYRKVSVHGKPTAGGSQLWGESSMAIDGAD